MSSDFTLTRDQRIFFAGNLHGMAICRGEHRSGWDLYKDTEPDSIKQRFEQAGVPQFFANGILTTCAGEFCEIFDRINPPKPAFEINPVVLEPGVIRMYDLNRSIKQYSPGEWQQAVTALALYRYYLQREISCLNDFLTHPAIQNAPELQNLADNTVELCREQNNGQVPMVDPVWAAAFLRRVVKEAAEIK